MDQLGVNGSELAYEVHGDGEPVLLVHGAFTADAMRPLADRLDGFRRIVYHRRGYGESSDEVATDVLTHAADALAILDHLDALPAHIVGHAYGAATALQLASDARASVKSLTLIEPAIIAQVPSASALADVVDFVIDPFLDGDLSAATDLFLRIVFGADYRTEVLTALPDGAFAQAIADADDGFNGDLLSLNVWPFGPERASKIKCPVLVVAGGASGETFRAALAELGLDVGELDPFAEAVDVVRSWVPHAELAMLPALNHAMHITAPDDVAAVVLPFLDKQRSGVNGLTSTLDT
jgi:pimeloyl-ACP methyl ester carboxylesterase